MNMTKKSLAYITNSKLLDNSHTNKSGCGFTIVEMLVVIPIIVLVIGVFIVAIVQMSGDVLSTRVSNYIAYNIQDTLDRIEQDVKLSGGYLATNNITLISPQGYNNDTTNFLNADSTNGPSLILNSYVTSSNPLNSQRDIIYASNKPYACSNSQVNQNLPVMMNVVYFIKDSTLWRRTIMPFNYKVGSCDLPWQQPSCNPSYVNDSYVFCKTEDIKLIEGIEASGFDLKYYQDADPETENTTATDPASSISTRQTALSTSSRIGITITVNNKTAGRSISQTSTTRTISPNNNISSTTLISCPTGFIRVPGDELYGTKDFCVMKYLASRVDTGSTIPISQPDILPWVSITQANATTYSSSVAECTDCHLITEAEWLTIAKNVLNVNSNWTGNKVGIGRIYHGHSDNSPGNSLAASSDDTDGYYGTGNSISSGPIERRTLTLSNGEIIWDLSGNVWEWTNGSITGNQPGVVGDSSYVWRDYKDVTTKGSISPDIYPSYGTPAASSWTSANQGIGKLDSYISQTGTRLFTRGGNWNYGYDNGIYLLALYYAQGGAHSDIGFRVTAPTQ